MRNGRVLISEEPLEVTHISWETRAIFQTVATPRKIVERLLSRPQSDSYGAVLLLSEDNSWNPISEASFRSLKFPRGVIGVGFSHSCTLSGGTVTIWVELKFREKTISLQGDERGVLSVAMWLVTTFTPEEVKG